MPMPLQVPIALITPTAKLPTYATDGDAGLDLRADASALLGAGEVKVIPTGVAVAIPAGFVGLVHPRSGLAARYGITVLNSPGTVDSGYRGELKVILINHSAEAFRVEAGDRIAQLVVQQFETVRWSLTAQLPDSDRGENGFGSTGVQ